MNKFLHNIDGRRFELLVNGHICYLEYREYKPKVYSLTHTWVPEALRGQGAAAKLTLATMEWCRDNGVLIIAVCPYIELFLKRYPEWRVLQA